MTIYSKFLNLMFDKKTFFGLMLCNKSWFNKRLRTFLIWFSHSFEHHIDCVTFVYIVITQAIYFEFILKQFHLVFCS
jgi:hypothetical protein